MNQSLISKHPSIHYLGHLSSVGALGACGGNSGHKVGHTLNGMSTHHGVHAHTQQHILQAIAH